MGKSTCELEDIGIGIIPNNGMKYTKGCFKSICPHENDIHIPLGVCDFLLSNTEEDVLDHYLYVSV